MCESEIGRFLRKVNGVLRIWCVISVNVRWMTNSWTPMNRQAPAIDYQRRRQWKKAHAIWLWNSRGVKMFYSCTVNNNNVSDLMCAIIGRSFMALPFAGKPSIGIAGVVFLLVKLIIMLRALGISLQLIQSAYLCSATLHNFEIDESKR